MRIGQGIHRGSSSALALAAAVCENLETRKLLSSVTGAYLFYNNSAFDGNNAAINASDDAAIATNKTPLRELGRATFANYSNYSRGLNGLMIDIDRPNGTPKLSDFIFRTGNDTNDPFQWSVAPTPTGFAIRQGAGQNGADRFEFTWDDNSAVKGKWLQATVVPTANTGILTYETYYFGSAKGDTGNVVGSARVDASDELKIRSNPANLLNPASITNPYDVNRDRKVDGADQLVARANSTNYISELRMVTAPLAPTGNLKADVYSPSEARLTWYDRSQAESYYSIQVQQSDGTFREIQQAVVNSTAALLTGLPAGSYQNYRVIPVASSALATMPQTKAAMLTITTPERLTASGVTWWAVTVSGSLVRGEAGFTGTGSASVATNKVVVIAESAEAAISMAVQGSAVITNTFVTPNNTKTYSFPNQSAFKVGSISGLSSISGFDAGIVKTNLNAIDSTMVIMLEDQIEWQPSDNDFDDFGWVVQATAVDFSLQDVTFGDQSVSRDSGSLYTGAQWHDDNRDGTITGGVQAYSNGTIDGDTEHVYPISFVRSSSTAGSFLSATVGIPYTGTTGDNWKIRGSAAGYTFAAVAASVSGGRLTASLTATEALPMAIRSTEVNISWEISVDGGTTFNAIGNSNNRLYVTGAAVASAFETVLNIGCAAADTVNMRDGSYLESDQRTAVDHIWGKFSSRDVRRVDGKLLKYNHDDSTGSTAWQMLADATGRGRCTSWADMMVQTLSAQGIGATSIRMSPKSGYQFLEVHAGPAQGSGTENYGATGFNFHQVVQVACYSDSIYDPSYGGNPVEDATDAQMKYEQINIAGYWRSAAPTWFADVYNLKELIW